MKKLLFITLYVVSHFCNAQEKIKFTNGDSLIGMVTEIDKNRSRILKPDGTSIIVISTMIKSRQEVSQSERLKNGIGFKWEKKDSVSKNKSQIYSDTKMFIAETWKSSKDVIQNDDKEGGIILIKAISTQTATYGKGMMSQHYRYVYSYNVTFMMKEGKYKIILNNVFCQNANLVGSTYLITEIQPFDGDNCPETGTFKKTGCPKEIILMMASFKSELQGIVDSYEKYIKTTSTTNSEW